MSESGASDRSFELNARLLRYRSRPGSEDPVALAEDLLAAGRAGDARGIAVLEQTEQPQDVRFLTLEARAWLLERDLARAQVVLMRGVKVDPGSPEVYRWLGEVLFARGDLDRAQKAVERGLVSDGQNVELLRLMARVTNAAAAKPGKLMIDAPVHHVAPAQDPMDTEPGVQTNVVAVAPPANTVPPPPKPARDLAPPPPPARAAATTLPISARPHAAPPPRTAAPTLPVFAPPPAAPRAAAAPVASPPLAATVPPPTRPRRMSPSQPRPAAALDAERGDHTLQGWFGKGGSAREGMPIAERRSGPGTLPLEPRLQPTPAVEMPTRKSVGESLQPVEITPRPKAEPVVRGAGTLPGLLDAPVVKPLPPASGQLSWDDGEDEVPTGEHEVQQPVSPPLVAEPLAESWDAPAAVSPAAAAAPDVRLGAAIGGADDPQALLDMLQRQGVFEPPTAAASAWTDRKEVPRTGTRLTTALSVVWVLILLLTVGGYFGWQQYVAMRHAEAAALTQKALEAVASADYAAINGAERDLRLASQSHPMSPRVSEAYLWVHAARALEDGQGDLSGLRAALVASTALVSRLKELGESDTVSPAHLAAANATAAALGGDAASARTALAQARAAAGDNALLQYWVARTAQRIGEPWADELLASLTTGPQAASAPIGARLAQADADRERGATAEALAVVAGALERSPVHLRARLWRAYFQSDQDAPDAALAQLNELAKEAAAAAPADRIIEAVTRARLQRRMGDLDGAAATIGSALQVGVTEPRLLALVAEEARRVGRLGAAQSAASQAVSGAPAVFNYRRLLAEVLIDRQDGARALTILAQLPDDNPEVLVLRARAALLLGTQEALAQVGESLDAFVETNPEASVQVKALRLRARVQLAPTVAVLREAEKLTKQAPGDPDALLALSEAALALRDGAVADRALSALVKVAPESVRAHFLLGRVKRLNGDADGAEASLRRTLELSPSHTDALIALGTLLLDRARYEEADALYQELSTRSAEAHLGRLGRVEALIGLARLDDAQVQWEGVQERIRDTPNGREIGARLSLARRKPGEALTLLRPLTEGPDRRATVMALYGDALYAADQVDPAAGAYDAALALDAGLPEALIGRGEVEVRAEKPDAALDHLAAAKVSLEQRIRPPLLHARMWLLTGRAYIQRNKRGDLEAARAALVKATAIEGVAPAAFFWLGESWAGKNTPEARAAYERYLALAPEGEFVGRARKALAAR